MSGFRLIWLSSIKSPRATSRWRGHRVTLATNGEEGARAARDGMDGYVSKPIQLDALMRELARVLMTAGKGALNR